MILESAAELKARLEPGQRLLALDVGDRTIGLALSDTTLTIANPLETLKRSKFKQDRLALAKVIAEHEVGGMVVGLPLDLDGKAGKRAQSVRDYASNLSEQLGVPVFFWDERFSTNAVNRGMLEADLSRKKRKEHKDTLAAVYILQGAMDMRAI